MASEYDPTVIMGNTGSPQEGNYQPTTIMGEQELGSGAYSQSSKTMRLRREPPTFAWLVVVDGVHAGHLFQLHGDSTIIGRDAGCDVALDDASVSRQHVKIRETEDDEKGKVFVINDLATENGTLVNGKEVIRQSLQDDDLIVLGETKLVFKQVSMKGR